MTLVPHLGDPKIRNLGLGDSNVNVTDANHSNASKAAHATAKIMGVLPASVHAPKKGCTCTVS